MIKIEFPRALAFMLTALLFTNALSVSLSARTITRLPDENIATLPDGTEFTVITIDEITSKTAHEGDQISFKVAEDVKINDATVIAKDTLVKGVVSAAKKAGMMGRGGNLSVRIESVITVDGQKLKLRSSKGKEGDDKTGATVALVVLFGPLGFLKHGKQATIKAGTRIPVFADEEKKIVLGEKAASAQ